MSEGHKKRAWERKKIDRAKRRRNSAWVEGGATDT